MSHSEPKADAITGPSPAKTQADVREFFERVLPWPPQDQGRYTGYCSIHWTMPDKKTGRKFGKTLPMPPGRPFQTLDDFMGFIDWAKGKDGIRDLYYCTSLQSTALPSKKPNGPMVAVKRSGMCIPGTVSCLMRRTGMNQLCRTSFEPSRSSMG